MVIGVDIPTTTLSLTGRIVSTLPAPSCRRIRHEIPTKRVLHLQQVVQVLGYRHERRIDRPGNLGWLSTRGLKWTRKNGLHIW